MQWGAGVGVWSFSPFLRYFALGNWKELTLVWQTVLGPFWWEPSPVLATKLGSPLGRHATPPTPGGHQRVAQTLQNKWACPLYHQVTLPRTGILTGVGLRLVVSKVSSSGLGPIYCLIGIA